MSEITPVLKEEEQQLVPSAWRSTLSQVVDAFKDGDYDLARSIARVRPVSPKVAAHIAGNIRDYGARLTSLPDAAWRSSVCMWYLSYWDVWVDLHTEEEGRSDLGLFVRVYEEESGYAFEITSVHVE